MSLSIIASITDKGRSALADLLDTGVAFTITDFVSGGGGHDSGDPQVALTPDPALTTLPSQTFGPKPLEDKVPVTPYCTRFVCKLENLDAVGNLSNVGLLATYTYSPIPNDPLIGTTFLYAVGNFPLTVKTDAEEKFINVEVEF